MAKKNGSVVYKCSGCGYSQPRWLGRCPECGEWNSFEECIVDSNAVSPAGRGSDVSVKAKPVPLSSVEAKLARYLSASELSARNVAAEKEKLKELICTMLMEIGILTFYKQEVQQF